MTASESELLRALHDEHAGVLWAYVVRLTNGDRGRAQDVVQETMLRAWRNPQVLDQSRGSARGWSIPDWSTSPSSYHALVVSPFWPIAGFVTVIGHANAARWAGITSFASPITPISPSVTAVRLQLTSLGSSLVSGATGTGARGPGTHSRR